MSKPIRIITSTTSINKKISNFFVSKSVNSSVNSINKIAIEISREVVKNTVGVEVNISNLSAIVEEISKKESKKYL